MTVASDSAVRFWSVAAWPTRIPRCVAAPTSTVSRPTVGFTMPRSLGMASISSGPQTERELNTATSTSRSCVRMPGTS